MRTIRLYGPLAKFLGRRKFTAEVASAAEAVRFLVINYPKLEGFMAEKKYRVSVGTYDLDRDELHHPVGQNEIKIIPVVGGAGGDFGRIILGISLIALSFIIPGAWSIAGVALQGLAFTVGVGLTLSGVAQLLMPVPELKTGEDKSTDPRASFSFSGIQNVSRQAIPIPIVYGKTLVGSVVVSAGVDVVQT